MAFDLNKNDGSNNGSSNKTQTSSKFDLSKGEAIRTSVPEKSSNSSTWIIGLAAILIIGGGIWYYSSLPKAVETTDMASTSLATKDSSTTAPAETQSQSTSDSMVNDTTAANPSAVTEASTAAAVVENTTEVPSQSASNDAAVAKLNNKVPATFGQGSVSFSRIDKSLIKQITTYLSHNPNALINVNGYASSDGSLEINQTISQARADAFKNYLVSKSVADNRVVATGKGIEDPIASNSTSAGRKKNRRVEVTFQ